MANNGWQASSPDDFGDKFWGDFSAPIFPPDPTLGYVPPPVVTSPTPYATMMVYANGFIGWIRNSGA